MIGKELLVMVLVCCAHLVLSSVDQYLEESEGECSSRKDMLSCTKHRVLRLISNYTENSYFEGSLGPFRMVRCEDVDEEQTIFSGVSPRFSTEDSEFDKFFKFVKRQVDHFLNHQSLVVSLPEGARFISLDAELKGIDSRGKKKKADLLISLITLFKVFKIKVLVALVLVGILVIKKVLLIGAFVLPSVIHNLKMSCMKAAQAAGGAYHHVSSIEADHDDYGGFGAYGANNFQWAGQNTDKSGIYQRRS